MRITRLALILFLCGIALISPAHARSDFVFNFFGFHYERHTYGSENVPSLNLVIENDTATLSGTWTAKVSDSKLRNNQDIWLPIVLIHDKSEVQIGTMVGHSDKYAFLFQNKTPWSGKTTIEAPAGSIVLTGKSSGKELSGQFTFTPNTEYVAYLTKHLQGKTSTTDLLELALHEVSIADIESYVKTGLKLQASQVLRLKNSGVSPEYCVELRKAHDFSIDEIIRLRNSGVDSRYPAEMQSAGYQFDADQLIRLRNSGVSTDYAREWKKAGFNYDADALIRMRNSGVPSDFAKAIHTAYPNISGDEIVRLRNSGISGDFVAEMKKTDASLSPDQLVRLRNSGVSPDYVKAWRDAGYSFSSDEIIRLRNSGVPTDYAAATQIPGRKSLSAATLIQMRNRGLSAAEIRELRE